jgi:hypothetical protein
MHGQGRLANGQKGLCVRNRTSQKAWETTCRVIAHAAKMQRAVGDEGEIQA